MITHWSEQGHSDSKTDLMERLKAKNTVPSRAMSAVSAALESVALGGEVGVYLVTKGSLDNKGIGSMDISVFTSGAQESE